MVSAVTTLGRCCSRSLLLDQGQAGGAVLQLPWPSQGGGTCSKPSSGVLSFLSDCCVSYSSLGSLFLPRLADQSATPVPITAAMAAQMAWWENWHGSKMTPPWPAQGCFSAGWYTKGLAENEQCAGHFVFHRYSYFLTRALKLSLLWPKSFYPKH